MFAFEILGGGAVGLLAGVAHDAVKTGRAKVTSRAVGTSLAAATVALVVAAIGGRSAPPEIGKSDAPPHAAHRVASSRLEASALIGPEGGVVAVSDPESRLAGTKVVVPAGALAKAETIRIASREGLPGPVPAGARSGGPIAVLTKDTPAAFRKAVVVTMPCKAEGEVPTTVYWDENLARWRSVTLRDVDRVNDLVTFETVHFTDFGTFLFNVFTGGKKADLPSVTTDFDPTKDGFVMTNRGDYLSDGNCIGMSIFTAWYSVNKRAKGEPPLSERFGTTTEDFAVAERELASYVQNNHDGFNSWLAEAGGFITGQAVTGVNLINQLRATGEPQVMILRNKGAGHAVVVYGYENGQFLIADPNFPGKKVTYDFDTVHGFRNYSEDATGLSDVPDDFYDGLTGATYTSFSSLVSDEQMELALAAADSRVRYGEKAAPSRARTEFVTIDVDSARVTGGVAGVHSVTVTGRISNVSGKAKHPVEKIRAKVAGVETEATIRRDGTFSIDVPLPAGSTVEDVTLYANAVARKMSKTGVEENESYAGQRTFRFKAPRRERSKGLAGALSGS